jgi:hypothetical protein
MKKVQFESDGDSLKPYYQDKWECENCGKCCLAIPCIFAQVRYGVTSKNGKTCPELVQEDSHYKCLLIERDAEIREVLISGDCDNPELTHLKKKVDVIPIVKEYFPKATKKQINDILWSHTGYPDFWNIPDDGWTATQCLRTQLKILAARRCSQEVMELSC